MSSLKRLLEIAAFAGAVPGRPSRSAESQLPPLLEQEEMDGVKDERADDAVQDDEEPRKD